jgi:hypothetical protein
MQPMTGQLIMAKIRTDDLKDSSINFLRLMGRGATSGQHFSIWNILQSLIMKLKLYILFESW